MLVKQASVQPASSDAAASTAAAQVAAPAAAAAAADSANNARELARAMWARFKASSLSVDFVRSILKLGMEDLVLQMQDKLQASRSSSP